MVKLWRCEICGDPYIGTAPPNRCPFCGAYENFIVEAREFQETFDVELNEKDKANEIFSRTNFYSNQVAPPATGHNHSGCGQKRQTS